MRFSIRQIVIATTGVAAGFALVFGETEHTIQSWNVDDFQPNTHVDVFYEWSNPDMSGLNFTRIAKNVTVVSSADEIVTVRLSILTKLRLTAQPLNLIVKTNPNDESEFWFH